MYPLESLNFIFICKQGQRERRALGGWEFQQTRDTERQRDRETATQRDSETERHRETVRDSERERDRQTDRETDRQIQNQSVKGVHHQGPLHRLLSLPVINHLSLSEGREWLITGVFNKLCKGPW